MRISYRVTPNLASRQALLLSRKNVKACPMKHELKCPLLGVRPYQELDVVNVELIAFDRNLQGII